MIFSVFTHSELTSTLKVTFNRIWCAARGRDKNLFEDEAPLVKDIYFYLSDENTNTFLSVGRYKYIKGIKIGNVMWDRELWGRASISTDPKVQGKGYGKELIIKMNEYALERKQWVIGFHKKESTLSDFYTKCGLKVDRNIGSKMYIPKEGLFVPEDKAAVSYFEGDPFIAAVKNTREKVYLPYSW